MALSLRKELAMEIEENIDFLTFSITHQVIYTPLQRYWKKMGRLWLTWIL